MKRTDKTLIVTGDDFGASSSVNAAIVRAHCHGILTSASLMANGAAFDEAVALAKDHPKLGVGIHISLLRGKSVLPPGDLSQLVDRSGQFSGNPTLTGFRYFFDPKARGQLEKEIEAQIRKFLSAGLVPSHIDGHLHLHVHPAVLPILVRLAGKYGIPAFRLPRENLGVNLALDRRNLLSKAIYTTIYHRLCAHAEKKLLGAGLSFPDFFFGLLQSGRMDETTLLGIVARLKPGVTEIGMHPAAATPAELERWAPHYAYTEELEALISPRVKEHISAHGVELTNYRIWQAGAP
jgi:hopanoid biosynthesis associated protein HpnK